MQPHSARTDIKSNVECIMHTKIVQSKPCTTSIQKYQSGTPPYLGNAAVLVDLRTKLRDKFIDAFKLTARILQQTEALERPRTLVARVVELDALRRHNL